MTCHFEKEISMEIVNPQAAGIDVGSRSHWVSMALPEFKRDGYSYKSFY